MSKPQTDGLFWVCGLSGYEADNSVRVLVKRRDLTVSIGVDGEVRGTDGGPTFTLYDRSSRRDDDPSTPDLEGLEGRGL